MSDIVVGAAISRPQEEMVSVCLRSYGEIVNLAIQKIETIYPCISLDCYVIMPNHGHILLCISEDEGGRLVAAPTLSAVWHNKKRGTHRMASVRAAPVVYRNQNQVGSEGEKLFREQGFKFLVRALPVDQGHGDGDGKIREIDQGLIGHLREEPAALEEEQRIKLLKGWHKAVKCALLWSEEE